MILDKPTSTQKQTSKCYLVLSSLFIREHETEILYICKFQLFSLQTCSISLYNNAVLSFPIFENTKSLCCKISINPTMSLRTTAGGGGPEAEQGTRGGEAGATKQEGGVPERPGEA